MSTMTEKLKANVCKEAMKKKAEEDNEKEVTVTLDKANDDTIYFDILVEYKNEEDAELDFEDQGSVSSNKFDEVNNIEEWLEKAEIYYESNPFKSYNKYVVDAIKNNVKLENGKAIIKEVKKQAESTVVDFNEQIRNKGANVKSAIDKIVERYRFRTTEGESYSRPEARRIGIEVWHKFDDVQKEIEDLYKLIG